MNIEDFWIVIAIMIILCAMVTGASIVVMRSASRDDDSAYDDKVTWHVELWSIRHGYQLPLRFRNTYIFGRAALSQYSIDGFSLDMDPTISRDHCMFYEQGGMLLVWNMSAINPTVINGRRLDQPVQIMPGDRIELGHSVFLVTRVERI